MRWLIRRFVPRFAATDGTSGEDGAMLVFLAASFVVLIGAMAISIDVGRIYQERRELQNGADAAALAVGHDCASGDCGPFASTADQYASANASDGFAGVEFVDPNLAAKKVTVGTITADGSGGSTFPMTIAQIIGIDGLTVKAQATVEWDGLKAGSAFPLLFREALWNDLNPASLVTLEEATSGTAPADRLVTLAHRSDRDPADPPTAAFEWLVGSVQCSVDVEVGVFVEHREKNPPEPDPPADCQGAALGEILNQVSLVAVFDGDLDDSSNTKLVTGIAALYITSVLPCEDGYCVTGYFISNYVVDGPLGGGEFGASAIRFVSE